jgi:hypothetical protein
MSDPILIAISAALAGKTATSLYDLVRAKLRGRPGGEVALAAATDATPDSPQVAALAEQLHDAEADDPHFREALRALWASSSVNNLAGPDGVVNQVSGTVSGTVVQARDVHGGISFTDRRG